MGQNRSTATVSLVSLVPMVLDGFFGFFVNIESVVFSTGHKVFDFFIHIMKIKVKS